MITIVCILILFYAQIEVSTINSLDEVILRLHKLLDFVLDNYETMNVDGMFGICKTQVYLKDAHLLNINNVTIKSKILNLLYKAETIYFVQYPNLPDYPFKYYIFKRHLLSPKSWKGEIVFSNKTLSANLQIEAKSYNVNEFKTHVLNNKFSETLFDACLVDLLTSNDSCTVNQTCFKYLTVLPKKFGGEFSGYRVTHMLLFLQVARMKSCLYDKEELNDLIQMLCTYILWEVEKNIELDFIPQLFDLLLEQIDLCGYEGYQQFFQKRLLDYILRNQNQDGCFKSRSHHTLTRTNRETRIMKHGCNSHSTGLGSSVLTLFLKVLSDIH